MDKKKILIEKIRTANMAEVIAIFLVTNIDKFSEDQIDWLINNL